MQGACMLLLFLTPASTPTSSELAVEFPVFLYIVHKLPQLDMHTIFLVSYNFFIFCCLVSQVQALQPRVPGSSLSWKHSSEPCSWWPSHISWTWAFTDGNSFWNQFLQFTYSKVSARRRQWHPTPVLLPGKSHGWRSLVGCSPWGR